MSEPILTVENLSFRYDKRVDLDTLSSISFSVRKGEWLAIIGTNGSGKSTLAQILVGLLKPDHGTVKIDGIELTEESKWQIRKKIGIVFQNPDNQFIGTTVEDDVAFSLENVNMPFEEMEQRVIEAIRMVGLEEQRKSDPSNLSGGQKQRVAIAGILALKPDILILDESFVMLDPLSRKDLLHTLKKLKEQQAITIISITHDMNEAAAADRIIELKAGVIANSGHPSEIFKNETSLEPPFIERLRRLFIQKGKSAPDRFMSEKEMVEWLCK